MLKDGDLFDPGIAVRDGYGKPEIFIPPDTIRVAFMSDLGLIVFADLGKIVNSVGMVVAALEARVKLQSPSTGA